MLPTFRKWTKRIFSPAGPPTADQARHRDEDARERRAQSVSALRNEIHRIQHEISDLYDTMTASSAPAAESLQQRMASLHRELADCQRELGTYQARI
jgi:capsule polysaccharide export protein KpsE/RkpR